MSSSLTILIPVLTGPNYQVWAPAMKSFLMSQGQWCVIQGNYTNPLMEFTGILWAALESSYGKPGVITTYLEFWAAIETRMSDHEDPSLCINRTISHLTRVIAAGLDIPKHFQAMIVMAKLPPSMDSFAQVMCQEQNIMSLDLSKIRQATALVWEQRQGKKAPPHNANKLSTVKCSPNEPPFEQQQGDGQWGG